MFHTIKNKNETYIYYNGKLIHKTRNNNFQSGVTFYVMAYRKNDSLKSIKQTMKYQKLEKLVIQWAKDKEILKKATPLTQIEKTQEELDETREALFWDSKNCLQYENSKGKLVNTKEEVKDGYGDQLVTLIIGAEMNRLKLEDCLEDAYNVISKRTGKMLNGMFAKD